MRVEKLTCNIGAELFGVNLGEASRDDGLFAEIKALLLEHKVLFLRDQDITRAEHVAFARRFGELEDHPVAGQRSRPSGPRAHLQGSRQPARALRERLALRRDLARGAADGLRAALRARRPQVGGDTIWVEHGAGLCGPARPREDSRSRVCAPATASRRASARAMPIEKRHALKARFPDAEHPVVRTHPETGEKVLFVNGFATHFTNFHTPQNVRYGQDFAPGAAQLLSYLIGRAAIPEYQVRWRWTANSVAIWDNRCTQHYAVQDYWPAVRKMERAGIIGDKPY